MGLDMYLHAKKLVSGSKWETDEKVKANFEVLKKMFPELKVSEDSSFFEVSATVGYWRKANAIHNWFVNNCQDGEDDCKEYYVSKERLQELQDLCRKELAIKDVVEPEGGSDEFGFERLEPTSGFFFGETNRDEWYYKDIQKTIDLISNLLMSKDTSISYYYQSSW